MTVTDYYFILNDEIIGDVYKDEFTSENEAGILKGSPTRKLDQGIGYDADNVIQTAVVTIPRGEKEFGGVTTLGQPTTYMAIFSRELSKNKTPFGIKDIGYAFE